MKDINDPAFWKTFSERQMSPVDAVPTHLPGLNALCRDDGGGKGFARGWFVTLAGNPGFGKSAMAHNLASMAQTFGESVGYISLEMSATQLAARFYSIHSGTPIAKLERGGFSMDAWRGTMAHLNRMPSLWVPGEVSTDWESVVAFVKDCHDKGCRWFVLDYLQLVQMGDDEKINRAITQIVTDLRAWAVNSGCTIVCLSQFNRTTSAEYKLPPRSQGLWGGMILEASSDMVLLLDHSRYERKPGASTAMTYLIIDKNRHGPVGELPIMWDYRSLKMREGEPDETQAWPK